MKKNDLSFLVNGERVTITEDEALNNKYIGLDFLYHYVDQIKANDLKTLAYHILENAPLYFYSIPASATGKYHAEWSTSLGGLVRHVGMGCQVALDLSRTFGFDDRETDKAIVAMLGHDTLKYGYDFDVRYMSMHPYLPREYYKNNRNFSKPVPAIVNSNDYNDIMEAIETHMGNLAEGCWTSVNIKPTTPLQKLVHLSDFIASRKELTMNCFVDRYKESALTLGNPLATLHDVKVGD